jgi:hypothetical protein
MATAESWRGKRPDTACRRERLDPGRAWRQDLQLIQFSALMNAEMLFILVNLRTSIM